MGQTYKWTVEVEYDFGGRSNGTLGIERGVPLIVREFEKRHIKAIFFVSTELLREFRRTVREIKDRGHTIGSHGHFHTIWKDKWRAEEDRLIAQTLLIPYVGDICHYRAPKFSYRTTDRYSQHEGHVGLLKTMWGLETPIIESIIYLHPFDIVEHGKSPNLFCKLWYSRPDSALRMFKRLCLQFS